ncbi:MAG: hypothetical protein ACOCTN_08265 [Candidatus Natronoplasma sp.]
MSMMKLIPSISFVVILLFTASISFAHVPQTGDGNESLESATMVEDPTKSWVIYSELREGAEANYYKMEMERGDRLRLSLLIPEETNFVPDLIVMGPGIESNESLPHGIEKPENVGHKVIKGELGEKEYEPFTPAAYYYPAEYEEDINRSGTYYAVIYGGHESGEYGLAIGSEERYGLVEWVRVPVDVINIHIWEGQPIWLIFAPMISVLGIGFADVLRRRYRDGRGPNDIKEWGLLTASLLYIGSGAMLFMQIGIATAESPSPAIIVSVFFASLPILFGWLLWRRSSDFKNPDRNSRVKMIFYGILGLFVWAGLIIGPIIAIVSALLPKFSKTK